MNNSQKKLVMYSGVGGLLEFYDFIIYALLASILSQVFFPIENELTSLLATFATFSAGYLARPIGGVIFSHFGDKYGRKTTFMVTIIIMAISTLAMGLIPSYQSIGITATVLLIFFRVLQGLSVGGEIPGAITYIAETVPEESGYATGIIFFYLLNGVTLGSVLYYLANDLLSTAQLLSWGWRVLFIFGGTIGFVGLYLRKKMEDSPAFAKCESYSRLPVVDVFKTCGVNLVIGTLVVGLIACYVTALYLFLPSYFKNVLHYTPPHYLLLSALSIFAGSLFAPAFGKHAAKIGKYKLIRTFSLITLILPIFIFKSFASHSFIYPWLLFNCVLCGALTGVFPSLLAELFPTRVRYSGIAISYNIGFAFFGGLAPVICLFLIKATGQTHAPAYYVMAVSAAVFLLTAAKIRSSRTGKTLQ